MAFLSLPTALPFRPPIATHAGSLRPSRHCHLPRGSVPQSTPSEGAMYLEGAGPQGSGGSPAPAGHVIPRPAGPAPGRLEATSTVAGRDHGWRACVPRPSRGARMKGNAITARAAESPSGLAVDADRPHHETPPPPAAAVPAGLPRRRAAPRRPRR